ncbi:MAG: carboxylating nicotinate-nucleotide diphosphorylase [Propionibacteriaceae bacterium]|jgi:nicotinate-nucleotide pyrophosphorylase (carboxylating)|nr:carboxylating nicotinate-nucleotide diphosphorylase [Propionibacteriaceae bacterium]
MLDDLLVRPLVAAALAEDLGRGGDITTAATIDPAQRSEVAITAREPGVVAGIQCAELAFALVGENGETPVFTAVKPDGSTVAKGDVIATVSGPTHVLLTAERVALNFLGQLSGIATATNQIAKAIAHTKAKIVDTRKTTPGLRALQKAAVVAGGGVNHRFGLDDAVLIKDNHIAAVGSVTEAIRRARAHVGHLVKIEVEVDTLAQLREITQGDGPLPDAVLLDNMPPDVLAVAVAEVAGRMITEASGNVTLASAPAIAASGVDLISSGAITHSAPTLDIGLDWIRQNS